VRRVVKQKRPEEIILEETKEIEK